MPVNIFSQDVDSPTVTHRHGVLHDHPMGPNPSDSSPPTPSDLSSRKIGNPASSDAGTSEAEMRSLYILLNLDNEGGLEVTRYSARIPSTVFAGPEVQFALEVCMARRAGNFVRFFRLLRDEASYLQACIMFKVRGKRGERGAREGETKQKFLIP